MKNSCPFDIVFQVLKVHLIKICKIEPPDLLFLAVFISFYISRYLFSQIFRTSFIIICKKISSRVFYFNRFTEPPTHTHLLINGQNQLSVTKVFCQYSQNIIILIVLVLKKVLKCFGMFI